MGNTVCIIIMVLIRQALIFLESDCDKLEMYALNLKATSNKTKLTVSNLTLGDKMK